MQSGRTLLLQASLLLCIIATEVLRGPVATGNVRRRRQIWDAIMGGDVDFLDDWTYGRVPNCNAVDDCLSHYDCKHPACRCRSGARVCDLNPNWPCIGGCFSDNDCVKPHCGCDPENHCACLARACGKFLSE